jgi:protein gp37
VADSAIEWTDKTWNPTVGCREISPGCKHCYAATMHARLTKMGQKKYADPFHVVKPWAPQLAEPLHWTKPARIFVNSMSDLFHEDVPNEYIAAVFGVMAACPQHTFQILTKRAERLPKWFDWLSIRAAAMREIARKQKADSPLRDERDMEVRCCLRETFVQDVQWKRHVDYPAWPLPNAWIGVSVEDQQRADERIPHLMRVPAAVRFLSVEPMLGPVDLARIDATKAGWRGVNGSDGTISAFARWQEKPMRAKLSNGVDWVIVGGESGHGARPFNLEWARSIVRQCAAAGVKVFFKQAGANPVDGSLLDGEAFDGLNHIKLRNKKGGDLSELPGEWPRQFPDPALPQSKRSKP